MTTLKIINPDPDPKKMCSIVQEELPKVRHQPEVYGPESHGVIVEHLATCADCRALDARLSHTKKGM